MNNKFADNSFEAKKRFGMEGDTYGIMSSQRLEKVRGKDFKKEKMKMKNKNHHGSGMKITTQINSIKF